MLTWSPSPLKEWILSLIHWRAIAFHTTIIWFNLRERFQKTKWKFETAFAIGRRTSPPLNGTNFQTLYYLTFFLLQSHPTYMKRILHLGSVENITFKLVQISWRPDHKGPCCREPRRCPGRRTQRLPPCTVATGNPGNSRWWLMFDSLLRHRHTDNNEKVYVDHLHRADDHAGFSDEDISIIDL